METNRLIIRKFEDRDYSDLYDYLSNKEVLRYEDQKTSSLEECKKLAHERTNSDNFIAVCLKENNRLIGHIYLRKLLPYENLTWEIGYIFNNKYWKKGYATEAVNKILEYLFTELRAHRVVARCDTRNIASWKLMKKIGMKQEACYRKNTFYKKYMLLSKQEIEWYDTYHYSILDEEWVGNR